MNYIEVYFSGALQNTYVLDQDTVIIGRSETANIRLNNKGVSNVHVLIEAEDERLFIEDLNSTNGTFLNEKKLTQKRPLRVGDSIKLSKFELKLTNVAEEQPEPLSNMDAQYGDEDQTIMVTPAARQAMPGKVKDFIFVRGDRKKLQKIILKKNKYRIGYSDDNDIQISGWRWLNRKYIAEIHRVGESFYLEPLKKTRVKVNDQRIYHSYRLTHNDNVQMGKLSLQFFRERNL